MREKWWLIADGNDNTENDLVIEYVGYQIQLVIENFFFFLLRECDSFLGNWMNKTWSRRINGKNLNPFRKITKTLTWPMKSERESFCGRRL